MTSGLSAYQLHLNDGGFKTGTGYIPYAPIATEIPFEQIKPVKLNVALCITPLSAADPDGARRSVIIFLMLRLGTGDPALDYPVCLTCRRRRRCWPLPALCWAGSAAVRPVWHLAMEGAASCFGISFASQRPVLDDMLNFLPPRWNWRVRRWY